jgi:hypothetical protein
MRRIGLPALLIYGLGLLSIAVTITLALLAGRPVDHFTRDPLSVMEAPFYIGLLSNINVATWFATAGVCWCIATVQFNSGCSRKARAMAAAAALVSILGADDLFMIHEEALQRYLGVPERYTKIAYAKIALLLAVIYRAEFRTSPWRLLVPASGFLLASIAVDQFTTGFGWRLVIEDSLKFLGVVGILAWALATAQAWLVPRSSAP